MANIKEKLTGKLSVSVRIKPSELNAFKAAIDSLNKERKKAGVPPIKQRVLFRKFAVYIAGDTKKAMRTIKYDEID